MTIRKILLIKPGAVGDLLQLTPVIRGLKARFPEANISLLVGSPAAADMFGHNPHLHETLVFDKKGEHRSLASFLGLWRRIRAAGFDLVVNYQRSNLKGWLLALAPFPCRILVYRKARRRTVHAVVNHLETVAPLGVGTSDLRLELFPGEEGVRFADQVLGKAGEDNRPLIALNPGASHHVNRWGTRQFALLADMLERKGCRIILIGGGGDIGLSEEIKTHARCPILNLTGQTTLPQLAGVLQRCSLLVSGDTGPMHLATAVGTRVVALFGAADPARTGPIGKGHRVVQADGVACIPCRRRTCSNAVYLECMEKITVEKVLSCVEAMLPSPPLHQNRG